MYVCMYVCMYVLVILLWKKSPTGAGELCAIIVLHQCKFSIVYLPLGISSETLVSSMEKKKKRYKGKGKGSGFI